MLKCSRVCRQAMEMTNLSSKHESRETTCFGSADHTITRDQEPLYHKDLWNKAVTAMPSHKCLPHWPMEPSMCQKTSGAWVAITAELSVTTDQSHNIHVFRSLNTSQPHSSLTKTKWEHQHHTGLDLYTSAYPTIGNMTRRSSIFEIGSFGSTSESRNWKEERQIEGSKHSQDRNTHTAQAYSVKTKHPKRKNNNQSAQAFLAGRARKKPYRTMMDRSTASSSHATVTSMAAACWWHWCHNALVCTTPWNKPSL